MSASLALEELEGPAETVDEEQVIRERGSETEEVLERLCPRYTS